MELELNTILTQGSLFKKKWKKESTKTFVSILYITRFAFKNQFVSKCPRREMSLKVGEKLQQKNCDFVIKASCLLGLSKLFSITIILNIN